jgi:thioredoxin reductase
MSHLHDCLIIGGGAAGLSAAVVLGRARRDVVLVDAGRQSNRPAHAVGGLLAQDGTSPDALYEAGRRQLAALPTVGVHDGAVVGVERRDDGTFRAGLGDGDGVQARRVLLATGMEYVPPDLPGVAERWGDAVFHCPFCHGWEARDGALAVLGDGDAGVYRALLLRGWSEDVVLLGTDVDDGGRARLEAAGVPIDDRPVAAVRDTATVVFADGSELPRDGLLVPAPMRQRSPLVAELGLELADAGTVVVDELGRTSMPGVFAAGDVGGTIQMVPAAMGDGARVGAQVRLSLLAEEHDLPFPFGAPAPKGVRPEPAAAGTPPR